MVLPMSVCMGVAHAFELMIWILCLFPLAGKTARSRLPVLSLFLVITGFQIGVAEREYLKSGYFVHIHVHD